VNFAESGYVHLPAVFTSDQIEALRADLAAHTGRDGTWKEGRQKKGGLLIQLDVHQRPVWREAADALSPFLLELLDGAVECYASMAIIKPREKGQRFPWHQDSAYYGDLKRPFVIAIVYLDDATALNGSLQVVPGSHAQGLLAHTNIPMSEKRTLPADIGDRAVLIQAKAGDVLLMDRHLVHGSMPNLSEESRRSVRLVYRRAA